MIRGFFRTAALVVELTAWYFVGRWVHRTNAGGRCEHCGERL